MISISMWDNLRQNGGYCITWPGKFCLGFVIHHHSSNSLGINHIRANQKRYLEGKQAPIYNKGMAGLGWLSCIRLCNERHGLVGHEREKVV